MDANSYDAGVDEDNQKDSQATATLSSGPALPRFVKKTCFGSCCKPQKSNLHRRRFTSRGWLREGTGMVTTKLYSLSNSGGARSCRRPGKATVNSCSPRFVVMEKTHTNTEHSTSDDDDYKMQAVHFGRRRDHPAPVQGLKSRDRTQSITSTWRESDTSRDPAEVFKNLTGGECWITHQRKWVSPNLLVIRPRTPTTLTPPWATPKRTRGSHQVDQNIDTEPRE